MASGREPGSGVVVITDAFVASHHALIISLAARNSVPAVFRNSEFVRDGALLSYGPDVRDDLRRAAAYVGRILCGAKPADLPIQLTVKHDLYSDQLAASDDVSRISLAPDSPPTHHLLASARDGLGENSYSPPCDLQGLSQNKPTQGELRSHLSPRCGRMPAGAYRSLVQIWRQWPSHRNSV
jgi:hypothetical protein